MGQVGRFAVVESERRLLARGAGDEDVVAPEQGVVGIEAKVQNGLQAAEFGLSGERQCSSRDGHGRGFQGEAVLVEVDANFGIVNGLIGGAGQGELLEYC